MFTMNRSPASGTVETVLCALRVLPQTQRRRNREPPNKVVSRLQQRFTEFIELLFFYVFFF